MKRKKKFLIGNDTDQVRVEWVLKQLEALPPGSKILDAGAGERRFKQYCNQFEYVAQDFGQYDGGGDGSGLQTGSWDNSGLDIISDITKIPVEPNSFDAILCSEVLEHVSNPLAAVSEFSRILKPGGILLITAPSCSLTHFAPYHFGGLNRFWYEHHLPTADFKVEEISVNGSWFSFVAQELRRSGFVGRTYSSRVIGMMTRIAAIPLIVLLSILSMNDRGSNELLCFGFMVRAIKEHR